MSSPKNQLPLQGVGTALKPTPAPASTGDWMQAQAAFQATPRRQKPDYAAIHRRRK